MLSLIAKEEEPKDEDEKNRIILENQENNLKKAEIEKQILELLANTDGAKILDDEKLLNTLTESK